MNRGTHGIFSNMRGAGGGRAAGRGGGGRAAGRGGGGRRGGGSPAADAEKSGFNALQAEQEASCRQEISLLAAQVKMAQTTGALRKFEDDAERQRFHEQARQLTDNLHARQKAGEQLNGQEDPTRPGNFVGLMMGRGANCSAYYAGTPDLKPQAIAGQPGLLLAGPDATTHNPAQAAASEPVYAAALHSRAQELKTNGPGGGYGHVGEAAAALGRIEAFMYARGNSLRVDLQQLLLDFEEHGSKQAATRTGGVPGSALQRELEGAWLRQLSTMHKIVVTSTELKELHQTESGFEWCTDHWKPAATLSMSAGRYAQLTVEEYAELPRKEQHQHHVDRIGELAGGQPNLQPWEESLMSAHKKAHADMKRVEAIRCATESNDTVTLVTKTIADAMAASVTDLKPAQEHLTAQDAVFGLLSQSRAGLIAVRQSIETCIQKARQQSANKTCCTGMELLHRIAGDVLGAIDATRQETELRKDTDRLFEIDDGATNQCDGWDFLGLRLKVGGPLQLDEQRQQHLEQCRQRVDQLTGVTPGCTEFPFTGIFKATPDEAQQALSSYDPALAVRRAHRPSVPQRGQPVAPQIGGNNRSVPARPGNMPPMPVLGARQGALGYPPPGMGYPPPGMGGAMGGAMMYPSAAMGYPPGAMHGPLSYSNRSPEAMYGPPGSSSYRHYWEQNSGTWAAEAGKGVRAAWPTQPQPQDSPEQLRNLVVPRVLHMLQTDADFKYASAMIDTGVADKIVGIYIDCMDEAVQGTAKNAAFQQVLSLMQPATSKAMIKGLLHTMWTKDQADKLERQLKTATSGMIEAAGAASSMTAGSSGGTAAVDGARSRAAAAGGGTAGGAPKTLPQYGKHAKKNIMAEGLEKTGDFKANPDNVVVFLYKIRIAGQVMFIKKSNKLLQTCKDAFTDQKLASYLRRSRDKLLPDGHAPGFGPTHKADGRNQACYIQFRTAALANEARLAFRRDPPVLKTNIMGLAKEYEDASLILVPKKEERPTATASEGSAKDAKYQIFLSGAQGTGDYELAELDMTSVIVGMHFAMFPHLGEFKDINHDEKNAGGYVLHMWHPDILSLDEDQLTMTTYKPPPGKGAVRKKLVLGTTEIGFRTNISAVQKGQREKIDAVERRSSVAMLSTQGKKYLLPYFGLWNPTAAPTAELQKRIDNGEHDQNRLVEALQNTVQLSIVVMPGRQKSMFENKDQIVNAIEAMKNCIGRVIDSISAVKKECLVGVKDVAGFKNNLGDTEYNKVVSGMLTLRGVLHLGKDKMIGQQSHGPNWILTVLKDGGAGLTKALVGLVEVADSEVRLLEAATIEQANDYEMTIKLPEGTGPGHVSRLFLDNSIKLQTAEAAKVTKAGARAGDEPLLELSRFSDGEHGELTTWADMLVKAHKTRVSSVNTKEMNGLFKLAAQCLNTLLNDTGCVPSAAKVKDMPFVKQLVNMVYDRPELLLARQGLDNHDVVMQPTRRHICNTGADTAMRAVIEHIAHLSTGTAVVPPKAKVIELQMEGVIAAEADIAKKAEKVKKKAEAAEAAAAAADVEKAAAEAEAAAMEDTEPVPNKPAVPAASPLGDHLNVSRPSMFAALNAEEEEEEEDGEEEEADAAEEIVTAVDEADAMKAVAGEAKATLLARQKTKTKTQQKAQRSAAAKPQTKEADEFVLIWNDRQNATQRLNLEWLDLRDHLRESEHCEIHTVEVEKGDWAKTMEMSKLECVEALYGAVDDGEDGPTPRQKGVAVGKLFNSDITGLKAAMSTPVTRRAAMMEAIDKRGDKKRKERDGGTDEEESQITGRMAIETRSSEALISEAVAAVAMMEEGQKDDGSQPASQQVQLVETGRSEAVAPEAVVEAVAMVEDGPTLILTGGAADAVDAVDGVDGVEAAPSQHAMHEDTVEADAGAPRDRRASLTGGAADAADGVNAVDAADAALSPHAAQGAMRKGPSASDDTTGRRIQWTASVMERSLPATDDGDIGAVGTVTMKTNDGGPAVRRSGADTASTESDGGAGENGGANNLMETSAAKSKVDDATADGSGKSKRQQQKRDSQTHATATSKRACSSGSGGSFTANGQDALEAPAAVETQSNKDANGEEAAEAEGGGADEPKDEKPTPVKRRSPRTSAAQVQVQEPASGKGKRERQKVPPATALLKKHDPEGSSPLKKKPAKKKGSRHTGGGATDGVT